MRNFSEVYNASKKEVLEQRAILFDNQKKAIVSVLKEEYMITGNITDLPLEIQKEMADKLLEYWSPKTGINKAGVKLLQENEIAISPRSTKEDIGLYITKQVKKHLDVITEAYRRGNAAAVITSIKEDVEPQIGKTLTDDYITEKVWAIIGDRIKNGLI